MRTALRHMLEESLAMTAQLPLQRETIHFCRMTIAVQCYGKTSSISHLISAS